MNVGIVNNAKKIILVLLVISHVFLGRMDFKAFFVIGVSPETSPD